MLTSLKKMSNQQKKSRENCLLCSNEAQNSFKFDEFFAENNPNSNFARLLTDFCTLLQSEFLQNRFISVGRLEPIGLVQKA